MRLHGGLGHDGRKAWKKGHNKKKRTPTRQWQHNCTHSHTNNRVAYCVDGGVCVWVCVCVSECHVLERTKGEAPQHKQNRATQGMQTCASSPTHQPTTSTSSCLCHNNNNNNNNNNNSATTLQPLSLCLCPWHLLFSLSNFEFPTHLPFQVFPLEKEIRTPNWEAVLLAYDHIYIYIYI